MIKFECVECLLSNCEDCEGCIIQEPSEYEKAMSDEVAAHLYQNNYYILINVYHTSVWCV